jgi:hypothetical protein
MVFVAAAFIGGAATPVRAEDCSFYRGIRTGISVSGNTITVNWQSQDLGGFPASCIGWMMVHTPGQSDWYGNPLETTPNSTHTSMVTGLHYSTTYEYVIYADFDGDGTGCLVLSDLFTTDPAPPPCNNYVLSLSESTTSSSFTVTFDLLNAASTRIEYRAASEPPGVTHFTAPTATQSSHQITVSGLSGGTEYTYDIEALCTSTGNWDYVHHGTLTTSSGGGSHKEHIKQLAMKKVWPIPTSGAAHLRFVLPRDMAVSVDIFDVQGRMVRNVVSGTYPAGEFDAQWDGRTAKGVSAPAGVYFARLQAGRQSSVKRFMVVPR